MKQIIQYECEKCGKKSENYDDIAECEAKHLGISVVERAKYIDLQWIAKQWSYIVNRSNNEENRNKHDEAIQKLINFEKEHDINQN